MENLTATYASSLNNDFLFKHIADKRVETWFPMKDPSILFCIICVYLIAVLYLLPKYMRDRPPFNIDTILKIYNAVQIVSCCYLIYGVLASGWATFYTFGCQPVDYSDDPMARNMLNYVYWTFVLKVVELSETLFFILRKKNNQVTTLHVYHHTTTLIYAWIGVKYMGGGMATFSILINSIVHVLMYSYYFLSLYGPATQTKLYPFKKYITKIQMVQFWIIFLHGLQALSPSCPIPNFVVYIYLPNMLMLFALFSNFYLYQYKNKLA